MGAFENHPPLHSSMTPVPRDTSHTKAGGGDIVYSCLTLCDPMDCSPPGSSVHGILQARILEWVATPSSRGFSQPRDRTRISCIDKRVLNRLIRVSGLIETPRSFRPALTTLLLGQG